MSEAIAILDRVGGARRIQMILVGLGTAGVIYAFTNWAMAPTMVPIGQGMPMDMIQEAEAALVEAGLAVELGVGGRSLSVAERDLARARVVLAGQGIESAQAAPGFELFDQNTWGMTDFTQRVNYRRALEGELERTISRMRGVESADVHLALQESTILSSSAQPSEASVVLALYSGMPSDPAVVEGISSLVSAAVEGLAKENVKVLDDAGRLLSEEGVTAGLGMSRRQLEIRQETERYLEGKAEQLLARVVGPGNSTVRVSAEMNFDQTSTTTQRVDPDAVVAVSETTDLIEPSEGQTGAGRTQSTTQFETTRSQESFQSGASRIERLSVAVLVADRATENADGTITWEPRDAAEIQRIESLVRGAVGLNPNRADEISVASVPFEDTLIDDTPIVEEGLDVVALAQTFARPFVGLAGLLTALFLGLRLIGNIKDAPVPQRSTALAAGSGAPALPQPQGAQQAPVEEAIATPQIVSSPPPQPAVQLHDPAMTARVLKAWLKEA